MRLTVLRNQVIHTFRIGCHILIILKHKAALEDEVIRNILETSVRR